MGATYEVHSKLRSMTGYDFQARGVPIYVPPNALPNGSVQLHATITRLWLETGEWSVNPMRRGIDDLQIHPVILLLILTRWIIRQHPCKRCTRQPPRFRQYSAARVDAALNMQFIRRRVYTWSTLQYSSPFNKICFCRQRNTTTFCKFRKSCSSST